MLKLSWLSTDLFCSHQAHHGSSTSVMVLFSNWVPHITSLDLDLCVMLKHIDAESVGLWNQMMRFSCDMDSPCDL